MREQLIRILITVAIAVFPLYLIMQIQDKTLQFLLGLITGIIAANIAIYVRTR